MFKLGYQFSDFIYPLIIYRQAVNEVKKIFDFLVDIVECAFRTEENLSGSVIQFEGGVFVADSVEGVKVAFAIKYLERTDEYDD